MNIFQRLLSTSRLKVGRVFRASFEHITGWHVYTISPKGASLEKDLRASVPDLDMRTVFDVGANVGQSARRYLDVYPSATIYSFEPVRMTFNKLEENLAQFARARCFHMAFGEEQGEAEMILSGNSDEYRLSEHHTTDEEEFATEKTSMETIDRFCTKRGIDQIDFLKIDTEGHDLAVLKGARQMLSEARISLVEVEVAMSPLNRLHVPFEKVKAYMESYRYYLFSIYEQVNEWSLESPVLRRTNAVFLSPQN